jgi:hypothetical protein
VPSANVTVSWSEPSLLHWLDMYSMFSTPLSCCSMGVAMLSETTRALAPGYLEVMTTVGGAISGYCEIGSVNIAIAPTRMVTIEMTAAKTGRSMKK